MKKITLFTALLFVTMFATAEDRVFTTGWSLGATASTNGMGVELAKSLSKTFTFRVGYESFDQQFEDVDYDITGDIVVSDVDYKTGSTSAFLDINIFRALYLTVGAGELALDPTVTGAFSESQYVEGIELTPSDIGTLTSSISIADGVTPYVGLGFGRSVSAKRRIAFKLEVGAYLIGDADVEIRSENYYAELANELAKQEADAEDTINEEFPYLPVVKLGLSYKFWSSKKK